MELAVALAAVACGGSGTAPAPVAVAAPGSGPEAVVVVDSAGPSGPLEPEPESRPLRSAAALRLVRDAWQRLDQTVNSCPEQYDYHPDFVRWLVEHAVPGADDRGFRQTTRPLYEQYVRPLARTFYVTYQKARADPKCFERELGKFRSLIKARGLPRGYYEKYFYFMNPRFCGNPNGGFDYFHKRGFDAGYDGKLVKTCVGFWLRRTMDGTADEFYRGLEKLLRAYDPDVLRA